MRWHANHHTVGTGHLYQGRFKSFPVQSDDHYFTVLRYVERNPLRAGLVRRAEQWRWSSAWRRQQGGAEASLLTPGPLKLPDDWPQIVAQPQSEGELEAVRRSAQQGRPYGGSRWQKNTSVRLGLEFTLRPRGRPKKPQ